ncbi:MAG TPA: sugar phosphate isomerase/epimerase [Bryobacteraceae bacterium]|jgi:sugar phosphate isomerase/epimerase|nr:sugar phosphate isomerase/epimerase [Bryobacteraceae bacterium]
MLLTRRSFGSLLGGAVCAFAADDRYRIGITTNTRGGWEKDVFLSFREAKAEKYQYVESFYHYFTDYLERPAELDQKVKEIGVRFVTISNGAPMEMHFEDESKHGRIVDEHLRLVRFIKQLGCDHLKINMGPRRPEGTTDADLKSMAKVLNEIGRRTTAEGLKFAVHAHMWSQFENRREIDYIMGNTDPKHVWFVLDTGHITMAGIDPVELAKKLGPRIVEFHLKDVDPKHRGGAKVREEKHEPMTRPLFFPLGLGGVDFVGLKSYLDSSRWRGWLTVELDSSPTRPPHLSARMSREYLEKALNLRTI